MDAVFLSLLRLLISAVIAALFIGLPFFAPLGALIGSRKGRGWTGFFLGMFLGIFGVIIVACMRGNRKDCPLCGEAVRDWATVCPHCQRSLDIVHPK